MNIKTITCHHVYNYGASLQAYALQHYLESLGNCVEIIDFVPWFHSIRYNPFYVPKNGKISTIVRFLPFMKYVLPPLKSYKMGMFKTWGRKKAFDKFEKDYYCLTSYRYKSVEELKANPPTCDVYVAGSDQIWNTYYENGKEPAYYLDFGDNKIKRISYAASLATSKIKEGYDSFVKEKVERFDAVSVREKTGAYLLKELGIKNVHVVLDPVFLLEKEDWVKMAHNGYTYNLKPNSYILVYDFLSNDNQMISFVKSYARKYNLQVVSINDSLVLKYADLNINDAGPLEFLSLIKNAACVIANSFHATAFSVIFEKDFYTFGLKGDNNSSRMHDLLLSLGLQERMNPKINEDKVINWEYVYSCLRKQISESRQFLITNI